MITYVFTYVLRMKKATNIFSLSKCEGNIVFNIYGVLNFSNVHPMTRYKMALTFFKSHNQRKNIISDGVYPDPKKWTKVAVRPANLRIVSEHNILSGFQFSEIGSDYL